MEARKLGLIPKENRTEHENNIYSVYTAARSCVTGSVESVRDDLGMERDDFYSMLDSDIEFRTALIDGFSDSRAIRLMELESALISLALGVELTEHSTVVKDDGGIETRDTKRKSAPNLSALQVLLEKYEGSSWTVAQRVKIEGGNDPQEIDYKMLSKAQLRTLAFDDGGSKKDE